VLLRLSSRHMLSRVANHCAWPQRMSVEAHYRPIWSRMSARTGSSPHSHGNRRARGSAPTVPAASSHQHCVASSASAASLPRLYQAGVKP
jgi:hypothetical protein